VLGAFNRQLECRAHGMRGEKEDPGSAMHTREQGGCVLSSMSTHPTVRTTEVLIRAGRFRFAAHILVQHIAILGAVLWGASLAPQAGPGAASSQKRAGVFLTRSDFPLRQRGQHPGDDRTCQSMLTPVGHAVLAASSLKDKIAFAAGVGPSSQR
jgi:hypothetical protein